MTREENERKGSHRLNSSLRVLDTLSELIWDAGICLYSQGEWAWRAVLETTELIYRKNQVIEGHVTPK